MDRGRGDGEEVDQDPLAGIGGGAGALGPEVDVNVPPAKEIVDSLVAMGIHRQHAEMAVQRTGADTAESAIAWVFENDMAGGEDDEMYLDYKMVFVVNTSLPMTPGKMAAQVGHAALGIYQDLVAKQDVHGGPLLQWNENGSKKIVLQCNDATHMNALACLAEKEGLPFTIIKDAGHTQIPSGSQTVMAIFGLAKDVDKVTGQLKLMP